VAVINTGLLTKGLRSEFLNRLALTPTHFGELATRIVSNAHSEVYRWLGTVPQLREWGTGRLARGLRTESYSIENLKYEATLEVDRDELADDQTGQIRVRIGELAERAATHKDYLIAQLLENGGSAGFESYDGAPFFSAAHESGASGAQSNDLDFEIADAEGPTRDEFGGALRQAIQMLLSLKDDQGQPMAIGAGGLFCVVPPTMFFMAREVISSTLINSGSNVLQGAAEVIAFPWLSSANRWYLLKNNGVVRPFIFQDREPIEFGSLTDESEEGFKREKYLFGVRARYRMAYGYWQFAVRTEFAAA
jgi:phage major head subunit gpT-like protein